MLLEGENRLELAWPTAILSKAVLGDGFGGYCFYAGGIYLLGSSFWFCYG